MTSHTDCNKANASLTATVRRRHWFSIKRRVQVGEVIRLSSDGIIILCDGKFPIGAEVSVNIHASDHEIQRLPAAIVRAEPAGKNTRYSLSFHKERLASMDNGLSTRLLNYLAERFKP